MITLSQLALQVGEGTGEDQQKEFEEQFHWALKTRLCSFIT